MHGRVLIVAGSDSGGGAGIQADIKTVTALGGYAMTAITALTAQDTVDVHAIHEVPADFVRQQMRVVLRDIGADCVKTGMLHSEAVIAAVTETLAEEAPTVPLVVDPVMYAKGGTALLREDAREALVSKLVPRATVITPNLPEAEFLARLSARTPGEMATLAYALLALGPGAVLLKGGHLEGETVRDILLDRTSEEAFDAPRIATRNTHGTGCTLASALATGLAQGLSLRAAVVRARDYLREAIRTAPGYGHGHGPLNHGHTFREA